VGAALPTHYTLSASSENTQYGLGAVIPVVVYHLSQHTDMLSSHWKLGNVHTSSASGQRLSISPVRARVFAAEAHVGGRPRDT
jgi:hypothetical protein